MSSIGDVVQIKRCCWVVRFFARAIEIYRFLWFLQNRYFSLVIPWRQGFDDILWSLELFRVIRYGLHVCFEEQIFTWWSFFFVFNLPKTLIIVFSNIYGTTSLVLTLIRDKNFFGYLFILIFNGRQHAVNKS